MAFNHGVVIVPARFCICGATQSKVSRQAASKRDTHSSMSEPEEIEAEIGA